MKTIFLSLLLLISTDPREIAKVNSLKKEAQKAFTSGDFQVAAEKYALLDSMGIEDPAIQLNLAHSYFNLNDTTGAKTNYQSILNSPDKKMRSVAYQQLGIMDKNSNKLEAALQNLKSSLKADPSNTAARYDYEVVKKLLEEQKEQEQENENQQDQENQEKQDEQQQNDEKQEGEENEEQEKQDGEKEDSEEKKDGEKEEGENEEGEEQESEKEPTPEEQMQQKLEEMNISEEKAQMILEAMRNNEVQYLQQQRRKATKRPESGKPDW